jgi:hypothetical protein
MAGKDKQASEQTEAPKKKPAAKPRTATKASAPTPRAKKEKPVDDKRGKHAKRPTAAEKILIEERRQFVWELFRRRVNVIKITQHLMEKKVHIGFRELTAKVNEAGYKACVQTVYADIQYMLEERRKRLAIDNDTQFMIDLDRLDDLQAAVASRAEKHGKKEDIAAELAIMDRRDRYLGISKAQRSENNARNALAELLGVDPEQIPNADGSGK